jgi:hypothetical protein
VNPLVERVAEMMYLARHRGPAWQKLSEARKEGYRETVREVLLAAQNAGIRISEADPAGKEPK